MTTQTYSPENIKDFRKAADAARNARRNARKKTQKAYQSANRAAGRASTAARDRAREASRRLTQATRDALFEQGTIETGRGKGLFARLGTPGTRGFVQEQLPRGVAKDIRRIGYSARGLGGPSGLPRSDLATMMRTNPNYAPEVLQRTAGISPGAARKGQAIRDAVAAGGRAGGSGKRRLAAAAAAGLGAAGAGLGLNALRNRADVPETTSGGGIHPALLLGGGAALAGGAFAAHRRRKRKNEEEED